jgi:hypothetical protein
MTNVQLYSMAVLGLSIALLLAGVQSCDREPSDEDLGNIAPAAGPVKRPSIIDALRAR